MIESGAEAGAALTAEVLDRIGQDDLSPTRLEEARIFVSALLARLNADDLKLRDAPAWAALANDLLDFMQLRRPGQVKVRVLNPTLNDNGWESSHTVIQIVTEDMSFLVDSVSMAIASANLQIHVLVHPVVSAKRDADGELESLRERREEGQSESVMHFEVDRITGSAEFSKLENAVAEALEDVRTAVADWDPMRRKLLDIVAEFPQRKMPISPEGVAEGQEFLRWVADDHFTFLGYREYEVAEVQGDRVLRAIEDSGLGILRNSERAVAPRSLKTLVASELPQSGSVDAIILTKTNSRSHVHRPGYMDYIGVLRFNDDGVPVAEQRFLGLFTSTAYMRRPQEVPLVRQKFEAVMQRSGLLRDSHSGKALRHILETLPRDELFQCTESELYAISTGILDLHERPRPRLFLRQDKYGRFFSCLAFIPRERYNTGVRDRVEATLRRAFRGEHIESTVMMGESPLARLHIVVRPKPGDRPEYEISDLEAKLIQIVRNWHDELREILVQKLGEERGIQLANRYGKALPAGYIEEVTPHVAASDVEMAASMSGADDLRLSLYRPRRRRDELRFKMFRFGADLALSEVLPMLENLGLRVKSEHVYEMNVQDRRLFIQDFEVQPVFDLVFDIEQVRESFQETFEAIWRGQAENDNFNRLALGARLSWRQVAMLRGYCKYLVQAGVSFSQTYMEDTLNQYPLIAGLLVELFAARFDPRRESLGKTALGSARKRFVQEIEALLPERAAQSNPGFSEWLVGVLDKPRQDQSEDIKRAIHMLLEFVESLDDDRILRSFLGVIRATLRTNFFQRNVERAHDYISFKFNPGRVAELPRPRPYREIFVYAPRMEGIHLRFGPVARGGLRWSDRREDFRTEVLGLVKAQMVKNTVIVPVGAKGGFIVKRPPAGGDRDAIVAEGIACYRMFINGLLEITDNLVDGEVVNPVDVVRRDDDDPYLVVAADKGTATFSDIANELSVAKGYWLGDAFASGGSHGYDHKKMGITAKGAWESVKRHFRALGRSCQDEDFTCTGIGDMSGDVFGNGMLLSRHIRLLAAFDHRHIFLDPAPDAEASYVERERLFDLPRSSWEDYDSKLISEGGGVYPRSAKSIPVSAQVRAALGLPGEVEQLPPSELMQAILKAPVDLLWNGGIGTYVKAASESNADAGDRANNPLRVNGADLRCKIVGEGGNLGLTQKGRIEAAREGVLLNTDFIDNSAGVDTSDHEVNIKILLNEALSTDRLSMDRRNELLAEMTDEVERLVLWDNYRQNAAITLMEHMSVQRLGSKAHFIRTLESEGLLDRQIEALPSDAELADRKARGVGLTRPELSVLLSYSKLKLYQQLLESDVPEDTYLSRELARYFPERLREPYAEDMERHRLRREIIASAVTNSIINRMGATFVLRMQEDTGRSPAAVAEAYTAAREILDARELWGEIEALDGEVAEATQVDAMLKIWALLRNMTRWLLSHPGVSQDIAVNVERYHPGVTSLRQAFPTVLTATGKGAFGADTEKWQGLGFGEQLAERLARVPVLGAALDVVEVARESGHEVDQVGAVFFELGEALELDWLRTRIEELPVESRWHAQARGALRDELNAQHRALAAQVLAMAPKAGDGTDLSPVRAWLERDDPTLKFTLGMIQEIGSQTLDYPIASVAVRRLAQLAQSLGNES